MSETGGHHGSPHWGSEAEIKACEQRGYHRENSGPWHDARDPNGVPVEIKATKRERSNGDEGRFRIFQQPHHKLRAEDGRYLFVVYRIRGRGMEVLDMHEIPARRLRPSSWRVSGHATTGRDREIQLRISDAWDL